MVDRGIVIGHLRECANIAIKNGWVFVRSDMVRDALELLKDQEPIEPEREHSGGVTWWNVCGACNTAINPNDKFCHECGRAVKWDG